MVVLGLHCSMHFSLAVRNKGYFSLHCTGFSFWWFLLSVEHRLWGWWVSVAAVPGLNSCSSATLEHRLHSPGASA